MKRTYQYALILIPVALMAAGCMQMTQPTPDAQAVGADAPQTQQMPAQQAPVQQTPDSAQTPASMTAPRGMSDASRFRNPAQGQSALDSAIELSKKFAALSEEMAQIRKEKEDLALENQDLKVKIAKIQPEAEQARKELAEANNLLVEMRIELNNWKSDVLGFREEMRQADKVQMEALLKILRVLGGEEMSAETRSGAGSSK